jgi:hypothetical protein
LPAETLCGLGNSETVYAFLKPLSVGPRPYRLRRDDLDFAVFCFAKPEVLLITALRAAETLARFHQEQADKMPPGAVQDHHQDLARRCLADIDDIRGHLFAVGATVEHQADAVRRHDPETAQGIIDRHVIMHGVGIHADNVPAARTAMARDIADALQAARGRMAS